MEQLTLFDISRYEYSFMISLPKRINNNVFGIRNLIGRTTSIPEKELQVIPHISLFKLVSTDNDNLVLSAFKQALMYARKFKVEIDGISFFNNKKTKTAYLSIANPEPITSICNSILSTFRLKQLPAFNPHLTIVKNANFDEETVKQLIPAYNDTFWCSRVIVLKKPVDDSGRKHKYKKIYETYLN